MLLVVCLDH